MVVRGQVGWRGGVLRGRRCVCCGGPNSEISAHVDTHKCTYAHKCSYWPIGLFFGLDKDHRVAIGGRPLWIRFLF